MTQRQVFRKPRRPATQPMDETYETDRSAGPRTTTAGRLGDIDQLIAAIDQLLV